MTIHAESVARLRQHRLLADLPLTEVDWIAAHGRIRWTEEAEVISSREKVMDDLLIVLSGRIGVWSDRGPGPRKVADWSAGDITGRLPYSRQRSSVGEVRAGERSEIVLVHRDLFPEMIRECPEFTARLVQLMLDRARLFTRHDLHAEKMASLGRLAAGLAHELDNPASAAVRAARLVMPALTEAIDASLELGALRLGAGQHALIEQLRDECLAVPVTEVRSPLAQARHEDAIADWLESHGLATVAGEALADTGVTIEVLDAFAERVGTPALGAAVRWVASSCRLHGLATELAQASTRVSELVHAVKGFTQMDGAAVPQPVDLAAGFTQTLTMLREKARARGIRVSISSAPELPLVEAVSGELNQIWFNLIDNALDAAGTGGSVQVEAARVGDSVVVRVIDDGHGVPPEIRDRIFEPFFTTKPVGRGTGLGLDIVQRLVAQHGGMMDFASAPGRTEFRVTLPLARAARTEAS